MGQTLCLLASYFPVRVTVKIEVLMLKLAYVKYLNRKSLVLNKEAGSAPWSPNHSSTLSASLRAGILR